MTRGECADEVLLRQAARHQLRAHLRGGGDGGGAGLDLSLSGGGTSWMPGANTLQCGVLQGAKRQLVYIP